MYPFLFYEDSFIYIHCIIYICILQIIFSFLIVSNTNVCYNVYEPYKDEAGKLYYTVGGTPFDDGNEAFTDIAAVNGGLITITPLKLDRTCGHFLKEHKGKILF